MPDMEAVKLADLIGARICHDLANPLGAINNGLELMMLQNSATGPEVALMSASIQDADARIRFFRLAFGAADNGLVSARETETILAGYTRGTPRVTVKVNALGDLVRWQAKLAFLAVLCCETTVATGGAITATKSGTDIVVEARSDRLSLDRTLWAGLTRPAGLSHISPAKVQFALLPLTAQDLNRAVTVDTGPDHVRLMV
ncbi:MAG: histidine phosphotransferase [Rhodobacteraceae bacterium]|nr:histidine phosphotransferase [Paracoccaceae bacterium]